MSVAREYADPSALVRDHPASTKALFKDKGTFKVLVLDSQGKLPEERGEGDKKGKKKKKDADPAAATRETDVQLYEQRTRADTARAGWDDSIRSVGASVCCPHG